MNSYINRLIKEKGIDTSQRVLVEGASGVNSIPLQFVIDGINNTGEVEKKAIRDMLVKIDFHNGDITHYLKHLAQALAI